MNGGPIFTRICGIRFRLTTKAHHKGSPQVTVRPSSGTNVGGAAGAPGRGRYVVVAAQGRASAMRPRQVQSAACTSAACTKR